MANCTHDTCSYLLRRYAQHLPNKDLPAMNWRRFIKGVSYRHSKVVGSFTYGTDMSWWMCQASREEGMCWVCWMETRANETGANKHCRKWIAVGYLKNGRTIRSQCGLVCKFTAKFTYQHLFFFLFSFLFRSSNERTVCHSHDHYRKIS